MRETRKDFKYIRVTKMRTELMVAGTKQQPFAPVVSDTKGHNRINKNL